LAASRVLVLRRWFFAITANLDLIEGVDGGMQMTLGQVQVKRRVLQALMAHQQLDGAQVGACFQQVRGKAMPKIMLRVELSLASSRS
jgi:hypothetical protein